MKLTVYKSRLQANRAMLVRCILLFGAGSGYGVGAAWAETADPDNNNTTHRAAEYSRSSEVEEITVRGSRVEATTTRLPLTPRELPQSISQISREFMDLNSITNINEALMNVTGVNVTLYDSQRPLYFARGFQITDFQVDGIPTYSGSTNQEYDTALYESIEVIRGANGLLTGVGTPSATVNMVRKRPEKELAGSVTAGVGSWNLKRGVGDVSVPITADGSWRSRFVLAYQDSDSFRDRYHEDKTAVLGVIEGDIGNQTTVALGYQNQDNNPEGTIWGTIPIFAADGSEADMPVATSFAPTWTQWQRESSTLFANVEHRFNEDWNLRLAYNRTEGDVFSLRVYATGHPDRETGEGMLLRGGVGAGEDTRDSMDLFVTGKYTAFGREHELVFGANAFRLTSDTPTYSSISDWTYEVPDAWAYDGSAPRPEYALTGAWREAQTRQMGFYLANRLRVTEALSLVLGARVTSWETGTDNFDTESAYTNTTGEYQVDDEFSPYAGIVFDFNEHYTLYASYTDIFNPVSNKDKNENLLEPVLGSNAEIGLKSEWLDGRLKFSTALFKTKQDNYPARDLSEPDGSLSDGSSAYISVDGTESEGIELNLSGLVANNLFINAGYTYVDTTRHENDRIWTNLPEHSIQLTTHYQFTGALENLTLGGGLNWQSETIGYGVTHPLEADGVTFEQDPYTLVNLYANWRFNDAWTASLAATNVFDKKYWANIDYANYGEPQKVSFNLRLKF